MQNKYIKFKVVFVTLTLPARQVHSDKEITNKLLNQFLIELQKYHNVKRYVWRTEKQENGNIHYHLLINEFIEYQELRKRWNRICNKLGYVDTYQKQMTDFFSEGFKVSSNCNDKRTIEQQRKAFIIGQKSNWTSPNSTDIHNTKKIHNIRRYVAKYMAKQPEVDLNDVSSIESVQTCDCRLWSCSHDLSQAKGCDLLEDWQLSDEIEQIAQNTKSHIYKSDYFSVLYIDILNLARHKSQLIYNYFIRYLTETFNINFNLQFTL